MAAFQPTNENYVSQDIEDDAVMTVANILYPDGYGHSNVSQILDAVALSDTALSKQFASKEALILAALGKWDQKCRTWLVTEMESRGSTPQEQLLALFDVLTEWFQSEDFRGCMFINATVEFPEHDKPIHQAAADHKRRFSKCVRAVVGMAGAANPDAVTEQLMILMEGSIVTSHTYGTGDAGRVAREMAERVIADALA